MKPKTKWTVGRCLVAECEMTLVMPAGAGRSICWLHAIAYGLPLALALATTACGADAFFFINIEGGITVGDDAGDAAVEEAALDAAREDSGDAATLDAADAAATDAPTDSADAGSVCPTACANVIDAYCARWVMCCPGGGNCTVGWNTMQGCKAALVQKGFDCNLGKYNKSMCSTPSTCISNINAASCNAIFVTDGPDTIGNCPAFWSQF